MKYEVLRNRFISFFEQYGYQLVPSSSLLPKDDPSVLLTTAGMQQFKPYYTNVDSPYGNLAISIQKCFRTSDIDAVGDDSHLTLFEMLGDFAFKGAVSKVEAIKLAWKFLTSEDWMGLSPARMSATYYNGNRPGTREDAESKTALAELIGLSKITAHPDTDNFWGPTGNEGPCGPNVEFYVDGVEVWNIVFNEFYCSPGGKLAPLAEGLGVDTGAGLERLLVAVGQNDRGVFGTDVFSAIMQTITEFADNANEKSLRIVADHLRASVFLIGDGVHPSNKEEGYVLRRLLRRAILHLDQLGAINHFGEVIEKIIERFSSVYPELLHGKSEIIRVADLELQKFQKTVAQGRGELIKLLQHNSQLSGEQAFELFATYGLPLDFIKDEAGKQNISIDEAGFEQAFTKHQEVSRAGVENKFGGHGLSSGAEVSDDDRNVITRLHTATHLLHAALGVVLGGEVQQGGSDLNIERARFDFTFPRALTDEEKQQVENWVNDKITRDFPVTKESKSISEALAEGAVAFFREKYPDVVDVYTVADPITHEVFSKEVCGGPHVSRTSEIGKFKIIKEQSSSAGVRRIKATVE